MIAGVKKTVEQEILDIARDYEIEKVILFGSRARGDYTRTSDIDLAIIGGNLAGFTAEIDEGVSTLLEFDVVNLGGSVQSELLEAIYREGITLYEKI